MDKDPYSINVTFSRSLGDDCDVVKVMDASTSARRVKLREQFVKELQAAYDHPDLNMAGEFKVDSITIDGVTYAAATGECDPRVPTISTTDKQALEIARNNYVSEDIEIDDDARFSQSAEGIWVSAWVWVSSAEMEEAVPAQGDDHSA